MYNQQRKIVERFFKANLTHPAIEDSLNIVREWTSNAKKGYAVPGAKEIVRLNDHGVMAVDIVKEILSLWMFYNQFPNSNLFPSDLSFTYQLANVVFRLAKKENRYTINGKKTTKKIKQTTLQETGDYIRSKFGLLAIAIYTEKQRQEEHQRKVWSVPFNSDESFS